MTKVYYEEFFMRKPGRQEEGTMALEHEALTEQIIGAAIEVHRRLGPGFIESIYEAAMMIELRKRGLQARQQVDVPVYYDGLEIGLHRLDLVVEETIIVELKVVKEFDDIHFAITRSYLKAFGKDHGLLLNFGKLKLAIKRVITRQS
jgi:GxxExxY protein